MMFTNKEGIEYICYLVKKDADTVAKRIDDLCKNQRYDGSFWEEALYNKDRMIVTARVVHKNKKRF